MRCTTTTKGTPLLLVIRSAPSSCSFGKVMAWLASGQSKSLPRAQLSLAVAAGELFVKRGAGEWIFPRVSLVSGWSSLQQYHRIDVPVSFQGRVVGVSGGRLHPCPVFEIYTVYVFCKMKLFAKVQLPRRSSRIWENERRRIFTL